MTKIFTIKKLEQLHTKYAYDENRDTPMLTKPPVRTFGKGGLWSDSLQIIEFTHCGPSRSGEATISLVIAPNDLREEALYTVVYAHHEGVSSSHTSRDELVKTMELFTQEVGDFIKAGKKDRHMVPWGESYDELWVEARDFIATSVEDAIDYCDICRILVELIDSYQKNELEHIQQV